MNSYEVHSGKSRIKSRNLCYKLYSLAGNNWGSLTLACVKWLQDDNELGIWRVYGKTKAMAWWGISEVHALRNAGGSNTAVGPHLGQFPSLDIHVQEQHKQTAISY